MLTFVRRVAADISAALSNLDAFQATDLGEELRGRGLRMIRKATAATLAAAFIAMSMFVGTSAGAQDNHVKWSYLLYLCADNNLDTYVGPGHYSVVEDDFAELMSVGSTNDVAMYLLVDRLNGPANLFKVENGYMEEMTSSPLNGREINMGDPATLTSFVQFASGVNPADHTLLVFWDHGSPRSVASDDNIGDAGGRDSLTHDEVITALEGHTIDVLCADECNVGQVEVAYEYATRTPTGYFVAAETYTGWRGFPYDATLRELTEHPDMVPMEAAVMMIDQTQLLLNKPPYMQERINSHSAVDLSRVRDLVSSIKGLTDLLTPDIDDYMTIINKARGNAQYCYGANKLNMVDLRTFVASIGEKTSSMEVMEACAAVLASFDLAVLNVHATISLQNMVCGLGITLPNHSWEMRSYYENFAFAGQGWLDFLNAYWAASGSV